MKGDCRTQTAVTSTNDLFPDPDPMEIANCPNQFSDDITIVIDTDIEDHCIIVLSVEGGRTLRMMGVNLSQGKNRIHVDQVNSLQAGNYQLEIKNTNDNTLFTSLLTKF